jgi:beta-lactamase class A
MREIKILIRSDTISDNQAINLLKAHLTGKRIDLQDTYGMEVRHFKNKDVYSIKEKK